MRNWIAHTNRGPRRTGEGKSHSALLLLIMGSLILAWGTGCRTLQFWGSPQEDDYRSASVLVVPPVSGNDAWREVKEDKLRKAFFRGFSSVDGVNAVAPPPSGELQNAFKKENLLQNGELSIGELKAIGVMSEASHVLAVNIMDVRPYGPQRVAMRVVWLGTDSSRKNVSRKYIEVDLSNTGTRQEYVGFLGQSRADKIRETLLTTDYAGNTRLHTGLLSNREFWRFVGYKVARALRKEWQEDKNEQKKSSS